MSYRICQPQLLAYSQALQFSLKLCLTFKFLLLFTCKAGWISLSQLLQLPQLLLQGPSLLGSIPSASLFLLAWSSTIRLCTTIV